MAVVVVEVVGTVVVAAGRAYGCPPHCRRSKPSYTSWAVQLDPTVCSVVASAGSAVVVTTSAPIVDPPSVVPCMVRYDPLFVQVRGVEPSSCCRGRQLIVVDIVHWVVV